MKACTEGAVGFREGLASLRARMLESVQQSRKRSILGWSLGQISWRASCLHPLSQQSSLHHFTHPRPVLNSLTMNISGTLNIFRLLRDPALCLPQHTVSTFNHLPIPLSKAFPRQDGAKDVDIQAVILDKDNCFAAPHTNEVHEPYHVLVFLSGLKT
jgi:hypothetical protein